MAVKAARTRSDIGQGLSKKGTGLPGDGVGHRDHEERKKDVGQLARHPHRGPEGPAGGLERTDEHGRAESVERDEAPEGKQTHGRGKGKERTEQKEASGHRIFVHQGEHDAGHRDT